MKSLFVKKITIIKIKKYFSQCTSDWIWYKVPTRQELTFSTSSWHLWLANHFPRPLQLALQLWIREAWVAVVKWGRGLGERERGRGIGERGSLSLFPFPVFLPLPLPFLCLPGRQQSEHCQLGISVFLLRGFIFSTCHLSVRRLKNVKAKFTPTLKFKRNKPWNTEIHETDRNRPIRNYNS